MSNELAKVDSNKQLNVGPYIINVKATSLNNSWTAELYLMLLTVII